MKREEPGRLRGLERQDVEVEPGQSLVGRLQLKSMFLPESEDTAHLLMEDCPLRMWDCAYEYLIGTF